MSLMLRDKKLKALCIYLEKNSENKKFKLFKVAVNIFLKHVTETIFEISMDLYSFVSKHVHAARGGS